MAAVGRVREAGRMDGRIVLSNKRTKKSEDRRTTGKEKKRVLPTQI